MSDELELEVVTLVGGPADGEDVEAPVGYLEIWHCVDPEYVRYERDDPEQRELHYAGEVLDDYVAMADWLEEHGYVNEETGPILHMEGPDGPRARTVELVRDDDPNYTETQRPQG